MILYYTGANRFSGEQSNPLLSIGDYLSSSTVTRLFGDISYISLNKRKEEFVGIILKNTTGSAVTNVTLQYAYSIADATLRMSKIEVCAVAVANSAEKVEKLPDNFQSPTQYGGTWYEATASPLTLTSNFPATSMILLWFKRSVPSGFKVPADLTDAELQTYYDTIKTNLTEGVDITINYTTA